MQIVSFVPRALPRSRPEIGVLWHGQIAAVARQSPDMPDDLMALLPDLMQPEWRDVLAELAAEAPLLAMDDVILLPPVARPGKILAIARNYLDHAREMGGETHPEQTWFNKQVNCVAGPVSVLPKPPGTSQLDYEGELVAVIGRTARNIGRADALDHVVGFMVGIDVSARDWQARAKTMTMGKSHDGFGPTGPYLSLKGLVSDIGSLRIETQVNGDLRQSGVVSDMIHSLPDQIAYLSQYCTLEPGDLLFTGTPAGVGHGRVPPLYLGPGDVVTVSITRPGLSLGTLELSIV